MYIFVRLILLTSYDNVYLKMNIHTAEFCLNKLSLNGKQITKYIFCCCCDYRL